MSIFATLVPDGAHAITLAMQWSYSSGMPESALRKDQSVLSAPPAWITFDVSITCMNRSLSCSCVMRIRR